MLAIERHKKILEAARHHGSVRTHELSSSLAVTEETIRRDLDSLARKGLLHRTHGGATELSMLLLEPLPSEREASEKAEKLAIAKLAVTHILTNETILLDASSTALELARHLPNQRNLRIVSYARDVIELLAGRNDLELILLGGIYDSRCRRFGGLLTEMAVRSLRIDRFFFSGRGFDTIKGLGEPNPEQARLKATILASAKWNCALIDHTKMGRPTDHYFATPTQIHTLVTDSKSHHFFGIPKPTQNAFEVNP